jgi:hypothetical protein
MSRFQVIVSAPNTFYRFLIVLPLPFQGGGQNLIKRNRRVLSVPMGIIVQLRLALR